MGGFLTSPVNHVTLKMQETRPPTHSPYLLFNLEHLTICRCNYKGSTFSSVIFRTLVLVRSSGPSDRSSYSVFDRPEFKHGMHDLKSSVQIVGQSLISLALRFSFKTEGFLYRLTVEKSVIIIIDLYLYTKSYHFTWFS